MKRLLHFIVESPLMKFSHYEEFQSLHSRYEKKKPRYKMRKATFKKIKDKLYSSLSSNFLSFVSLSPSYFLCFLNSYDYTICVMQKCKKHRLRVLDSTVYTQLPMSLMKIFRFSLHSSRKLCWNISNICGIACIWTNT